MDARRMINALRREPFVVKKLILGVDYNERQGTGELFHRDVDIRGKDGMNIEEVLDYVITLIVNNPEVTNPKFTLSAEGVKKFCLEVNDAVPEYAATSAPRLRIVKK